MRPPAGVLEEAFKEPFLPLTKIDTVGMESPFTCINGGLIGVGSSDPDREIRDFILGAVATAGR